MTQIQISQWVPARAVVRLGVVADTHVPDRLKALPPRLFELLSGVDLILHAGDFSRPKVLDELARIAPVVAVQGNRDIFYKSNRQLPLHIIVQLGPIRIGLTHGHGGLASYLREKLTYLTMGYYFSQYEKRVHSWFTDVRAIVFGHTHYPVNRLHDQVLLFNPGSVGPDYKTRYGPAVGRLTVNIPENTVRGEILPLTRLSPGAA